MKRLTTALGGQYIEARVKNFTKYVAVHPLGGCPMGDSVRDGVVDARTGEVFGHKGLTSSMAALSRHLLAQTLADHRRPGRDVR